MATGSTFTGIGGLDGSIAFELGSGENLGSAFVTTLTTFAPFFSSQTSLSDLISAGVYTAARSCGGPIVPVRGGHIDATAAGGSGVPLPGNSAGTFRNQFLRIGYSSTEMIAFVACGHTLGGVHAGNFPDNLPVGTAPNDFRGMDTTPAVFDNRIAVEFVDGTTRNPLVIGASRPLLNPDNVVFSSDSGNGTIKSLAQNAANFTTVCGNMFQRMIEVVPSGVTLTSTIKAYEVRPYGLQLTLLSGGAQIKFTGEIRVRTTQRTSITGVQVVYKDRTGAAVSTPITAIPTGDASGFDDTFSFFGFDTTLSASTSISSFTVVVSSLGGTSQTFDNNGNGFGIDDSVIYQVPQSCIDTSGHLTVVAAVRNGASPNLNVVVKNPRASPNPVPSLSTATTAMATQSAVGSYQLYSGTYTFSGSQAQSAVFGVTAGSATVKNKSPSGLPTACSPLGSSTPTTTPSSPAFAFQGCYYDAGAPRALSGSGSADDTMTVEKCSIFCKNFQLFGLEYGRECYCGNALHSSSTPMGLSDCNMPCSGNSQEKCGAGNRMSTYKNLDFVAPVSPSIAGYNYLGCYSEGSAGRALIDSATASDAMTVQACATFCNGATYFGVEYGAECYCGAQLQTGSTLQPSDDCSMLCAGNSTQFCGAGNRLNMYQKAVSSSSSTLSSSTSTVVSSSSVSSSTPTPTTSSSSVVSTSSTTTTPSSSSSSSSSTTSSVPTPTPSGPSLAGYTYSGCYVDSVASRLLSGKSSSSSSQTYANCASYCDGYQYFGVEYGGECYCADKFSSSATVEQRADSECGMACTGAPTAKCGDASRITVFKSNTVFTPPGNPEIEGYTYAGCHTDSVGERVLQDAYYFDSTMTIEKCKALCVGTNYFGTQYGGECYCGNAFAHESQLVSESECSFVCGGNKSEYCGAGNRLSLYEKTST
jgi:hypothetical protein